MKYAELYTLFIVISIALMGSSCTKENVDIDLSRRNGKQ